MSKMSSRPELRTAEGFLDLLADDPSRHALLACSAGLSLDDEVARQAIELVARSNGSTDALLKRIKGLSCVWQQWDGTWYVAEDVRRPLMDRLQAEVPSEVVDRLHVLLAEAADRRKLDLAPDGQLSDYRMRACHLESGYQQAQVPGREETGAERLLAAWQQARPDARDATAVAVDHLAPDLERPGRRLPDAVLFLRGMAARARRDSRRAEGYFRTIWEHGRPGEIQAIAAHLFGNLTRNKNEAERAFRDSLEWNTESAYQGQVWHSLANLLAREPRRWREAEAAYHRGLELLSDPRDQSQVWHSLANLLARERGRWNEAERIYHLSLDLDRSPYSQAQVWHSLANLLAKESNRWNDAENAYMESLELRHDPYHQGQVTASWANALVRTKTGRADLDRAAKLAQTALVLDPGNLRTGTVATKVLAEVYRGTGDSKRELKALESLRALAIKQHRHRDLRLTEERIREIQREHQDPAD